MSLDRRTFVRAGLSGLAATVSGVPLLLPTAARAAGPVRTRLEKADKATIDALIAGVGVMKSRNPSDPRSWFFQAAVHGVTDAAFAAAQKKDPGVTDALRKRFWNKCPHGWPGQTAFSAEFILWHRAYVYYFERILRAASKYDGFALPYWNYTGSDPKLRLLPEIFRDTSSVLYDGTRNAQLNRGEIGLLDSTVDTSSPFGATNFFDTSTAAFAGSPVEPEFANQARMERVPHNRVHGAIGGNMGDPAKAGFDPVFWAHHCNIDRLWNVWACLPNRSWGFVPSKAWLDATPWSFYDATGDAKSESRGYWTQSPAALGITFDTDGSCRGLPPPTPGKTTRHAIDLLIDQERGALVPLGVGSPVQLGTAATTKTVPVAGLKTGLQAFSVSSPERLVLQLDGITAGTGTNIVYDVYAGLPKGSAPDPKSPYRVGTIDFFHPADHGTGHGGSAFFDITALAKHPGFDAKHVDVTFQPVDLLGSVAEKTPVPRRADGVTVKAVSVHAVTAKTF